MERGNGTTEEKEKGTKEKVSEQTEMGSVWQADEWKSKVFENMSEMHSMMAKEGCEMEKEKNLQDDR